jgi:TRAP-type C4-dicarboxylate transport system permease small subunit
MSTVDRLLKWIEWPINILLWIGLIAGFMMMIHVSVDVTGRTVFNRPFAGTTEIVSAWYMVAVCYLPWAWLTRHNNHIVAGVFERIGTRWFGFWVEVGVKVVMLIYVSMFAWQTWVRAIQQTRAGEVWEAAGGFIPVWPMRWILPISAILMGAYLVLRIIREVGTGYQPEQSDGEPREGGI